MRWSLFKTEGEQRIEGATWGLLIVWVGAMMISKAEPDGLPSVGAGAILLLSAVIQKALGYDAGFILWAGGLFLVAIGLDDLLGEENVSLAGIIIVVLGLYLAARALTGRNTRSAKWQRYVEGRVRDPRERPSERSRLDEDL